MKKNAENLQTHTYLLRTCLRSEYQIYKSEI